MPAGGEQHWLEGTRRLQLDSLGGGPPPESTGTVQHVCSCSDPARGRLLNEGEAERYAARAQGDSEGEPASTGAWVIA